jgi:hypothetical protein
MFRYPGYKSRGPKFDFQRYHIFSEVLGLERNPLNLMRMSEKLLGKKKVAAPV